MSDEARENIKTGVSWTVAVVFLAMSGWVFKSTEESKATQAIFNTSILRVQTQMSTNIDHMKNDIAKLTARSERYATMAEVRQLFELEMAKHQRDQHAK